MKVYVAKVWWNWTNSYTTLGIFSTKEKAQKAIEVQIKKNIKQQPERPNCRVDEYELDHFE